MNVLSLERRLQKVETRHRKGGGHSFFLVWAQSKQELPDAAEPYRDRVREGALVGAVWPFADPAPDPRWRSERDVNDQELEALIEYLRGELGEDPPNPGAEAVARRMSDADLLNTVFASPVFRVPDKDVA